MTITFTLNGKTLVANKDETIWQAARRSGVIIPHLCHRDEPGYRADGNCRACVVEIEGERTLASSCTRKPVENMVVHSETERAKSARKMVFELLKADMADGKSEFDEWAKTMGVTSSRFAASASGEADTSHPAIIVNLEACIQCNLCVRACREVQVNDVIGMSGRGSDTKISFDIDDPMGASSCVGCGECVAVCPTGALSPKQQGIEQKQIRSVCPYCGVGCQIVYHVHNDKIIKVEGADGPANENRLCIKGRFGFDYVASPQRLTTPLIRKPDTPKGINIDPADPYTHFRKASWSEALDFAAYGLRMVKEKQGPRALAGFGSAKCSNEEAYLFQKLIRTGFGSNNVDHCTRLCHASSVAALMQMIGSGAVTAPFTAAKDSDLIITIGCNPAENHPVAATFFKQAAKRGCELIVMDPRGTALKRHATHMLQFRPGSDVALLNAMMNVIVHEGIYDRQYVDAHTEGFADLKQHLEDYTPEAMSIICGISPDEIRTVARKYAGAKAAIIFWGMGVSQHTHGTDNARCLIDLAMLCGQIGRKGTGLHPLRGQNNVQGASDAALIPMFFPDYKKVSDDAERARFEDLWDAKLDGKPGLTVVETMNAIHAGEISGMYIMGENPAMSDPDLNHARGALAKLEHLVVQDIFLTETAMFADVVLPATAWPEKDGTASNTNRQIQMGRKAIVAPGEAQADWWIIREIANRFGLEWTYRGPQEVFDEMKEAMASLNNISWDRLMQENVVTYPCPAPDHPGNDIVFGDRFPTESGLGRFIAASVSAPDELPDKDYPFILSTGRILEHWHTGAMTRRSQVLDEVEPEPIVQMNTADIEELNLKAGQMVEVISRRGSVQIMVRADNRVSRGLIFIPFAFVEAAANLLTNPKLDPFGKIPEFKFCAVNIKAV